MLLTRPNTNGKALRRPGLGLDRTMIDVDWNVSSRIPTALHASGRAYSPPTWMAVGLRGLARMTDEELEIAVDNIEALVQTAYGNGPTAAMRDPGARDRARDVLIRLGWA